LIPSDCQNTLPLFLLKVLAASEKEHHSHQGVQMVRLRIRYLVIYGSRMHIAKKERKHVCLSTTHDAKVRKAEESLSTELGVE
jgi:hypothetical protein